MGTESLGRIWHEIARRWFVSVLIMEEKKED